MRILLLTFLWLCTFWLHAQDDSEPLMLILPPNLESTLLKEGETFVFQVRAEGGAEEEYIYTALSRTASGYDIDENGEFTWFMNYDLVSGSERAREFPFVFTVRNGTEVDSVEVYLRVRNVVKPTTDYSGELKIEFPRRTGWNLLSEGDTLLFKMSVSRNGVSQTGYRFFAEGTRNTGILLDSIGDFFWAPDYEYVDRLEQTRDHHVVFFAEDKQGNSISEKIIFTIFHKNRAPILQPLPTLYAVSGAVNVFEFSKDYVQDPDGDPVVVIPIPSTMPQGAEMSSQGRFSWRPSRRQFLDLVREPIKVEFYVEDQPYKDRVKGSFMIEANQMDLPPEITMVPPDSMFVIDEDDFLNINFYLSDPNGDNDIKTFDFVSEDIRVTKDNLRKNTDTQYEFVWKPGYQFVEDPYTELTFKIRFFVFDLSNNSSEKSIVVRVNHVEDLDKMDLDNYNRYYDALVASLDMIDQLDENQQSLEKQLRRAKKGKKNRALFGAGIGAVTGLAPVVFQDDAQKVVSGVGGTTTMTLGTLEAKSAIGTSLDELNNQIKVNVQLRNKINNEANAFARRYNSKSGRRNDAFQMDVDKLTSLLNSEEVVKLQLDANWENSRKINNRRLKREFADFEPFTEE